MPKLNDGSGCITNTLRRMSGCDIAWFAIPVLFVIFCISALGWESTQSPAAAQHNNFLAVAHWFDPVFFQYNLIMVSLAILILPFLVLSYTHTMIDRKERRLLHEVKEKFKSQEELKYQEDNIKRRLKSRASFGAYGGSLFLTMAVVSLGACILLLFKPTFSADGIGVHFNLGANMLLMGPFIELFGKNMDDYFIHLSGSLVAFQFGFLGAYIYFISSLARAYFTLDLSPQTLVDGSIRMIVASVLALILSFAYGTTTTEAENSVTPDSAAHATASVTTEAPAAQASSAIAAAPPAATSAKPINAQDQPTLSDSLKKQFNQYWDSKRLLPVISFFFGFYPRRALSFLDRIATKKGMAGVRHRELPLSSLAGVSYAHESRLEREGIDNIENLSHADAVDLAIRTGFGYQQLAQWIEEAWLAAHLREDYSEFVQRTGITSREELRLFFSECALKNKNAVQQLKLDGVSTNPQPNGASVPWEGRLASLEVLLTQVAS